MSDLNAICPYYTMFPLDFPTKHLKGLPEGSWVLDPFCGRGTTTFAARKLGLPSVGLDVSPVAIAISQAKTVAADPDDIVELATQLLTSKRAGVAPVGRFWQLAFHQQTLVQVLKLRAGLRGRSDRTATALRALALGALHGPLPKSKHSYFSNQMQRTFAPKPDYAVRFWSQRGLRPPDVDVLEVIRERAERYYSQEIPEVPSRILLADARRPPIRRLRFSTIVTSPPYFGMQTYVPDQWLRMWFLGGPSQPEYGAGRQLAQGNWVQFATSLGKVWRATASRCLPGARLVVRMGSLPSRRSDPEMIMRHSLQSSRAPWKIERIYQAGDSTAGHRQATQMGTLVGESRSEYEIDVVCRLQ